MNLLSHCSPWNLSLSCNLRSILKSNSFGVFSCKKGKSWNGSISFVSYVILRSNMLHLSTNNNKNMFPSKPEISWNTINRQSLSSTQSFLFQIMYRIQRQHSHHQSSLSLSLFLCCICLPRYTSINCANDKKQCYSLHYTDLRRKYLHFKWLIYTQISKRKIESKISF